MGTTAATVLARLERLSESRRLLVASDFDGTLAETSLDPWAPSILPQAQRALRRLVATPHVHVALISGRTVTDLARRVRVGGVSYRGDHGAERAEAVRGFRVASLKPEREPSLAADIRLVDLLTTGVPRSVPEDWLVTEHKASNVTFHFRGAPDIDVAHARVSAAIAALDPHRRLQRSGSRRAIELRPVGAADKGTTLRQLIEAVRPTAVIMLGDDHNDALAFDVLREARAAGHIDGLAIAVATHADVTETVAERADVTLAGPREVARLLAALSALTERAARALSDGGLAECRCVADDGAEERGSRPRDPHQHPRLQLRR